MTTSEDIERFCGYFEAQIEAIDKIRSESDLVASITQIKMYKKTLFVSAIDTLAGFRFSKENYRELNKQNRARFIRFVVENCEWENGSLISIPYLFDQLNTKKLKESKLYEFLRSELLKHDGNDGGVINIEEMDLKAEKLLEYANSEIEENLIYKSQHYSLFYGYRNCLVHEAREPGQAMEAFQTNNPHYHSYIQHNTPQELTDWHLSYPVGHFKNLFECSVKNSKIHFIKTDTNPFSMLSGGRWW